MDRIATTPGALLTELNETNNARTGKQCMGEFEGSLSDCQVKKLLLEAQGATEVTIRSKGNGYWTLQAHFPFGFDGTVTDLGIVPSIHELDNVVQQTSIYRSTKLRTLLSTGASAKIGKLMRIIQEYQAGQDDTGTGDYGQAAAEAKAAAVDGTYGVSLLRAVAYLGVEEAIEYYSVYKRTLTAATPRQVVASYEGVGKIWTTTEVQTYEGIDPAGWFQLNSGSNWLKSRPNVIAAFGQKTQVIYTYTECQTALALTYDAYSAATLLTP
jgi:hypothetical protein